MPQPPRVESGEATAVQQDLTGIGAQIGKLETRLETMASAQAGLSNQLEQLTVQAGRDAHTTQFTPDMVQALRDGQRTVVVTVVSGATAFVLFAIVLLEASRRRAERRYREATARFGENNGQKGVVHVTRSA
jgi:hypothetical protein